jgi:hypothetical protein
MAKKIINIGQTANDKSGDPLRTAFSKVNDNFTELYNMGVGGGASVTVGDTPPSSPTEGSLWWNSEDGKLYIDYNSAWIDTSSPSGSATTDRLSNGVHEVVLGSDGFTTFPGGLTVDNGRAIFNSTGNGVNIWDGPDAGPYNGEILLSDQGVWLFSNNETNLWKFDNTGTLTVPHLFPKTFTATVDSAHYYGEGSLTLSGDAWYFEVTFNAVSAGTIETVITNNTPWFDNPGYVNDIVFRFTEADHGVPGYTFDLTLTDIQNPGPNMWTTNLTVSPAPAYPATIKNGESIKLTADATSFIFGADGNIHLPAGGVIKNNDGSTYGGSGASTGNFTFTDNLMYNFNGTFIDNSDLTHNATSALILPSNSSDPNPAQLNNFYGAVEINTGYNNANTWTFDTDGNLTVPGEIKSAAGTGDVVVEANDGTARTWTFGADGLLTFPDTHLTISDSTIGRSVASGNNVVGSRITFTDSSTSLETYSDPDGPNNTQMARHYTDGILAGLEVYEETAGGRIGTSLEVTGSGVGITSGDGVVSNNWIFAIDGTTTLPGKLWAQASDAGSIAFSNNGTDEHGYIKVDAGYNMVINAESSFYIKRAGGDRIAVSETLTELSGSVGVVLHASGKSFSIASNGTVTLPENFRFANSTGSTILDRLSYFTNDLEINANSLTGTILNTNVTESSLTKVGTLSNLSVSGIVHITNTDDSINADTGSLQVDGGAHVTKNLIAEGTIYAGKDAYSEALTNPLIVASSPANVSGGYSQVAILNNSATASGDFQVMIDGYDVAVSDTGWADLGMAGSSFSDERYTITQPGDGYVFVSGLEGSTNSGNLVLGTDSSGTTNDIVFATGGFLTANEKMRLKDSDGSLDIASGLISSGNNIVINADTRLWTFGSNGHLTLPPGGDIKDSTGTSVLGGGSYTLPTASTSTLGGVKVDGTTIVINNGVISSTVVGAVTLKGTWDASTNTPTLGSSLPSGVQTGWQYLVSVTGTRDIGNGTQTYTAGDIVMFDGVAWVDIPGAAGSVASFNNRTGAVSLTSGDVTTALGFTPYNATNPSGYITSSSNITGNAATATKLASSVTINGVAFDGSGNITVAAAAGTLTGTTLNAGITGSSLTSVGTLTNLTVTNPITGSVTGSAGSVAASALTGNTLASGVTSSSLTSVGTLTDLTVTNTITGSISGSAPAGSLSGSTLASGVTASSLTSVGTLTALTVGGTLTRSGNVSAAAWGTAGIGLKIPAATYTDTTSVTSLSQNYVHTIGIPTLSFTNTTTISQAATLFIAGDPIAGTNASLTSNYSFGLYNGGKTYLAGSVRVAGSILSGGGASMLSFSNTQSTFAADVSVSGQLYLPNRPAFRVYGNGGQVASVTTLTSSNWTQDFQQGTALNASTGIFTAPYAGLYQVNLVVRAYTNSGVSAQVICRKTAITGGAVTSIIMIEWAANTTMNHTGGSTIVKLAVGDTLKVDVTLGSISFDGNDNWSVAFIG